MDVKRKKPAASKPKKRLVSVRMYEADRKRHKAGAIAFGLTLPDYFARL